MEDNAGEAMQSFSASADICQQLLTRYARSSAGQHRHLCATAAASRSIIEASSLPLTPISYFATCITSLSSSKDLDSDALGALTSLLSIVLPLVGKGEIKTEKAEEAVRVLVRIVEESVSNLGTSGVRAVVKCVGVLVVEFCNLKEWNSVSFGVEWLVKFSLDKRPKVRKCAQDYLLTLFKSFESPDIFKKGSKLIYRLLKDRMPMALEMSTAVNGSKNEATPSPEHQEVIHLLNVMQHLVPYISPKFCTKILSLLVKILSSQFSVVTRHVLHVISSIFETSGNKVVTAYAEEIFRALVSFISLGEKNPVDAVLLAASLAETALGKLHNGDADEWATYFPMLTESLAGLLLRKGDVALKSSNLLRGLIDHHIDGKSFSTIESQDVDDNAIQDAEFKAIQATCSTFYNLLRASSKIPNEHFLSVVAFLFLKLGGKSDIFMKDILLKLADLVNSASATSPKTAHLQECIGSAVVAMGPAKLLALFPITLNTKNFSCSNLWLIPILKKNIVGSSLQYFIEHIVPLAKSLEKGSRKVEKSVIGQDLQACAHGCWGLLPAFCRKPSDTYKSFGALVELLIPFLKKESFMIEDITISLQELVNESKSALASNPGHLTEVKKAGSVHELAMELKTRHFYSTKIASKNIKALASCAKELLLALTNVLFESPPETRIHLKGAIKCLVSICDASVTKQIFIASLEKYQLLDDVSEQGKIESNIDDSANEKESRGIPVGTDANRCLILELAACIVEASDDDLVNLVFSVIKHTFQESNEVGLAEAYETLSRILEKNSSFCSSQLSVVMDLLMGLRPSSNITLLKSRLACLQTLLIHALMRNMDEDNTKTFLILNELILTLKDSNEEGRKSAYDVLNGISTKLRSSSDASCDGLYHKLLTMIIGYLSGASPHIKSGVVSALSVFVYNDPRICVEMPDVFTSVMELLHSKAVEIIKAVLGFVKVLVSCLEPNDLQGFLSDIMDGILRWSSVSRHHFKTKIVVILEIMMRKCGPAALKPYVPDKYKDFVQGVVANRHGKTSSKEAESKDTDKPEQHSDMSHAGLHKRKREESGAFSKEEGSSVRPSKRKWDNKKQKSGKSFERVGFSNKRDLRKGKSNKPREHGSKFLKRKNVRQNDRRSDGKRTRKD